MLDDGTVGVGGGGTELSIRYRAEDGVGQLLGGVGVDENAVDAGGDPFADGLDKIGRASCRERV